MNKPARLLAIETSSSRLSMTLGDGQRALARYAGEQNGRHADQLFDGIAQLLRQSHWTLDTLSGIAVSIGPGSFTGIRIGLAAARTLGQFLRIPVVGVSSLETLAWMAARTTGRYPVSIDALQGRVFAAIFERTKAGAWKTILKPSYMEEAAWTKKSRGTPLTADRPSADALLDIARPRLAKAKPGDTQNVLPLYLREAAAVERRKGLRRD